MRSKAGSTIELDGYRLWAPLLALAVSVGSACGSGSGTASGTETGPQASPPAMPPPSASASPSAAVAPADPAPPATPAPGSESPAAAARDTSAAPSALAPETPVADSAAEANDDAPETPDAGGTDSTPTEPPPVTPAPQPFAPCPTGSPCKIMPLGDSITFGVGSSGGGYRVELFHKALSANQSITFVGTAPPNGPTTVDGQPFPRAHEGHSGFTISGGGAGSLAGLTDAAIASTKPNIILLLIGTNDINGNVDIANAPARLGVFLDQILKDAPDALLAVSQIIPTTNQATTARVQTYNAAIPGLVQARAAQGKHIVLVDLFTPFQSNPNFAGLMNDLLHPNDTGYVVLADTWYSAISSFLP